MTEPTIWKTHKYRESFNECPHCGAAIRWIYSEDGWLPCDREPVLFIMHPHGNKRVVHDGHILESCLMYRKNDSRFGGQVLSGNVQHYYNCPVLKKRRYEYAMNKETIDG